MLGGGDEKLIDRIKGFYLISPRHCGFNYTGAWGNASCCRVVMVKGDDERRKQVSLLAPLGKKSARNGQKLMCIFACAVVTSLY